MDPHLTGPEHPITPPPELMQQWRNEAPPLGLNREHWIATQAARWGADQELEACCKLLDGCTVIPVDGYASTAQNRLTAVDRVARLRAARRPKPPSLAEQALAKTEAILNDPSRVLLTEVREALECNRRTLRRLQGLEEGND